DHELDERESPVFHMAVPHSCSKVHCAVFLRLYKAANPFAQKPAVSDAILTEGPSFFYSGRIRHGAASAARIAPNTASAAGR
ncbi:MAG: hypothetical protein R6U98_10710, partial [Pirellulaceae bacterium]